MRHFLSLGIGYGAFVLAALFLYFLVLLSLSPIGNGSQLTSALLVLFPVLAIHFSRKDVRLLQSIKRNIIIFLWTEYHLLLLPSLVLMLVKGFYPAAVAVLIVTQLLPFIIYNDLPESRKLRAFPFIPPWQYEWRSGLRKSAGILVVLLLLSLITLIYPYVSFFFLWIMHAIIVSFYRQHESEVIVRQAQAIKSNLLRNKVVSGISTQLGLFAPVAIIYTLIHQPSHWIVLFLMFMFTVSLGFSIVVKYRYFHPEEKGGPAAFYQSLSMISPFIPFLLPLPLLLGWMFWKKANRNIICHGTSD
jgi:hypothetical protein